MGKRPRKRRPANPGGLDSEDPLGGEIQRTWRFEAETQAAIEAALRPLDAEIEEALRSLNGGGP